MSEAVSVTLGGMGKKARKWVEQGDYASMSEVVREGLRALEREQKILDDYYRAKLEESLADPRPRVPLDEAIARIKATPYPQK